MTEDEFRRRAATFSYQASGGETLSEAVVEAVATASGREPVPTGGSAADVAGALDPLYTAVDPDALDAMFHGDPVRGEMTFHYHDYEVTAHSDGRVTLAGLEPAAGGPAN